MVLIIARDVAVGDVIRLDDDRQAHRVESLVVSDGEVIVQLRPVGLAVPPVWRELSGDAEVERLATAAD